MIVTDAGITLPDEKTPVSSLMPRPYTRTPQKTRRRLCSVQQNDQRSVPDISVRDALLPYYSGPLPHGADRFAEDIVRREDIADHPFRPVRTLSGAAPETHSLPRAIGKSAGSHSLRSGMGLDVASVMRLRNRLRETAAEGIAVLN